MNDIQKFESAEFGSVRTTTDENGKIYFCGKDVAEILGYSNPHDALLKHCKKDGVSFCEVIDNVGRKQGTKFIDEGNLYRLIFSSKLPTAEKFTDWVTREVLPTIRKHGAYMTEETLQKAITSPDFVIQLAQQIKAEQEKNRLLEKQNAANNQIINELKPKADYTDSILNNKGLVTITQIAKDYGKSGNEMNDILNKYKIQYKQSGQWLLYAKYQKCGYTHSETVQITHSDGRLDVKMNTKWTQKGRLFLYNFLKNKGIVPVIEDNAEGQTA